MNVQLIIAGALMLLIPSCASKLPDSFQNLEKKRNVVTAIKGEYANSYVPNGIKLWSILTTDASLESDTVKLSLVDGNKKLQATRMSGTAKKQQVEFSCSVKGDYIQLSRLVQVESIAGPLLWGSKGGKELLCVDQKGNLNVFQKGGGAVYVGPMPISAGGTGKYRQIIFNRVNE